MMNSGNRIEYIQDYMSSYEAKIRRSNSFGLFDNAKLFELFGKEICGIWFDQRFLNLNLERKDYPCVDLVSENRQIYVQCSTQEDIVGKVKSVLSNIAKSSDETIHAITTLYFFTLDPVRSKHIPCYLGKSRIGNIDFDPKQHLITPEKIIRRAIDDIAFQIALYELLVKDSMHFDKTVYKFEKAVERSKLGLAEIDGSINGEYIIDRSDLLNRIRNENKHFIIIEGEPGVGKSALCKMLVEETPFLLYARADELAGSRDLDDLWNIDIEKMLYPLGEAPVFFFIDALEFIADGVPGGIVTLMQLYERAKNYDNAYIIASCRTSEIGAFASVVKDHSISVYKVKELTPYELMLVSAKFPVIRDLMEVKAYHQILTIPFYVNLIVSKLDGSINIEDENELRHCIWRDVICLGQNISNGISSTSIVEAVKKITFERARRFLPGIPEDEIDRTVYDLLISNGIIVSDKHKIRLKYDIFEDICFEEEFGEYFDQCAGNYKLFFDYVDTFGECAYRRYQIWVENKLFGKQNRDRFVSKILFGDSVPLKWREQTIIGIVRSRYCSDFIQENEVQLFRTGIYINLLNAVNLHAYEIDIQELKFADPFTIVKPVGSARKNLILFAGKYRLAEKPEFFPQLLQLFTDYAKQEEVHDKEIAGVIIEILEKRINQRLAERSSCIDIEGDILQCLQPLYIIAEFAESTICSLWERFTVSYLGGSLGHAQLAERIIEETIFSPPPQLARYMPARLCELANVFWLKSPQYRERRSKSSLPESRQYENPFRLTRNARNYKDRVSSPEMWIFMQMLLQENFWLGLKWGLSFINTLVERYEEANSQTVTNIEIEMQNGEKKDFYGSGSFWAVCSEESNLPELISDIIYLMTLYASKCLESNIINSENKRVFSDRFKRTIYSHSNSIIPLRIIADLGTQFESLLPDYVTELVNNPQLIVWDLQLYAMEHRDPVMQSLVDDIFTTVGIPALKPRYQSYKRISLYEYILKHQLTGRLEQASAVIDNYDCLQGSIAESGEPIGESNQTTLSSISNIATSGENELVQLLDSMRRSFENNVFELQVFLNCINALQDTCHEEGIEPYITKIIIVLTVRALSFEELTADQRSDLCDYWINGINKLFRYDVFSFDRRSCAVLFQQIEKPLRDSTAKNLRFLMLRLLTEYNQNGQLDEITDILGAYLSRNTQLAESVLMAIIAFSKCKDFRSLTPECPIENVRVFLETGSLQSFLESSFDDCEIPTLSYALRCGLSLDHPLFREICLVVLRAVLVCWNQTDSEYRENCWLMRNILRTFCTSRIHAMEDTEVLVELMFDDSCIGQFTVDSVRFYIEIFTDVSTVYFDAYEKPAIRYKCEEMVTRLEELIPKVPNCAMRNELTKIMFLSPWNIDTWRLHTHYSYQDKVFMNRIWSKYGALHVTNFLQMLYELKIDELLPEVLLSVRTVFEECGLNQDKFRMVLHNNSYYINTVITQAVYKHRDEIKQDEELKEAYEAILNILIDFNIREAAVLYNEFRIH